MILTQLVKKEIVRYNEKLHKLLNSYSHVSIVEASSNRDHYTKHGLHLNNYGKEELVKQTVIQINSVKWIVNSKTPIPLLWKENTEGKVSINEDKLSNGNSGNVRRTSSRNKKLP